jgi:hypothetical protein
VRLLPRGVVPNNPVLRLELRRIRRRRWWPGRRFFLFYPALLGIALGFGVMLVATDWLGVQVAAVVTGVSVGLVLGMVVWLLGVVLPWIAPALAAPTIARERELGTLDLLRVTLLSERAIVLGKFGGCLAQLWPGILLLILLAPFQLIGMLGGNALCLCPSSYDLAALMLASGLGAEYLVGGIVLQVLIGTLRPLADVLLHAALGMFASALARSSGVAVAVSYGTVLVMRVAVWLATSVAGYALLYGLLDSGGLNSLFTVWGTKMPTFSWLLPFLAPMVVLLIELAGATVLVWGAAWRLKRE